MTSLLNKTSFFSEVDQVLFYQLRSKTHPVLYLWWLFRLYRGSTGTRKRPRTPDHFQSAKQKWSNEWVDEGVFKRQRKTLNVHFVATVNVSSRLKTFRRPHSLKKLLDKNHRLMLSFGYVIKNAWPQNDQIKRLSVFVLKLSNIRDWWC